MKSVLNKILDKFCTIYLDDIIVFSTTLTEHLNNIDQGLNNLQEYSLYVKPTKFRLGLIELEYLDYIITSSTVNPNLYKIEVIFKWVIPKNKKELQTFLGF